MRQKIKGVVFHTSKYNDTSQIVDIYTEQYGWVSYMVPISRSKKSLVRGALFQPLALVEFETDYRPGMSLQRMREVSMFYVFSSLPYDPVKSAVSFFLAEFFYRALRGEDRNVPLFAFLVYSIRWLDVCERNCANFHLVFLMRLSRFLGFYPNLDGYYSGACFDLRNACFVSTIPSHPDYIAGEEAGRIVRLMRMNYETMHLFAMSREERWHCLEVIGSYYRLHLPVFPLLKSLDVLKELFG